MSGHSSIRLAALSLLVSAAPLWAGPFDVDDDEEDSNGFKISGLLDVRYAHTSQQRSWFLGGPNKLRYGGADINDNTLGDRDAHVAAISQASLVFDIPVQPVANVHVQLNFDGDTDAGNTSAGVVEAYATLGTSIGDHALEARLGHFIPAISWEHPETAWSTRYTLTPSAIGSWISEDVRATGAEGVWQALWSDHRFSATFGGFTGGDQTGWMLMTRGWTMHDYQADFNAELPLPNGQRSKPSREFDGRAGYFGRGDISIANDLLHVAGGYWDNNSLPSHSSQSGTSEPTFYTRFWDAGGKLQWRWLTIIGQYMRGDTLYIGAPRIHFSAWYAMASAKLGKLRISGRHDRMKVFGIDSSHAITAYLGLDLSIRQRLSVEYVHLYSDENLSKNQRTSKDEVVQFNYRFLWGG